LAGTAFGSGCFGERTFVIKTCFFSAGSRWGAGWEGTLQMFHRALPECCRTPVGQIIIFGKVPAGGSKLQNRLKGYYKNLRVVYWPAPL
jgi:hypothetical protein